MTLKEHREKVGMTQEMTARAVGVRIQVYQRWEYGRVPKRRSREALARAFGVSPSDIDWHGPSREEEDPDDTLRRLAFWRDPDFADIGNDGKFK